MQNKQQLSFKKFLEAKTDKVKSTLKTAETIGSFQLHLLYFFFLYLWARQICRLILVVLHCLDTHSSLAK